MIPSALRSLGTFGEPADQASLASAASRLGHPLPIQYEQILRQADGFLLDNGTKLYSSAEVPERNETFEVQRYAPGYVAVGDDSGGRAFMLSLDPSDSRVYAVGQGVMDPKYMRSAASDVSEWLRFELQQGEEE